MASLKHRTYSERAKAHPHPLARQLLDLMDRKQTNLILSVDVTSKAALLRIVEAVADEICVVKTHIDIVSDFDGDLVSQLTALSQKHDFLIFEDRKFADIGNTVRLQYEAGIYRISSWAHITNAHPVPGDGVVTGLASVGQPLGRGLLLLAEMSSGGALTTGMYTDEAVRMARRHKDFVMGFISQRRLEGVGASGTESTADEDFLVLSPGVGLDTTGDGMGQQYRTPEQVIVQSGADCIIVGRGIYGKGEGDATEKIGAQGKRYREAGWQAYLARTKA